MKRWTTEQSEEVRKMKKGLWMVVVLVLLLGLIVGGSLCASSPEPKIVFVGKDHNAYVAGIDGKNSRKITSSGLVSATRWLDADTVAVLAEGNIWLVQITDTDEKKATRLTRSGWIERFACSADGKWIAFTENEEGLGVLRLCQINRDGSGFRVLRRDSPDVDGSYQTPVIAGQNMVFCTIVPGIGAEGIGPSKIWMLDSKSKQDRCLYTSESPAGIGNLVNSKDGQRVVFDILDVVHDRFSVKEIDTRDFQVRSLAELPLGGTDSSGKILYSYSLCSLMHLKEQILLGYERIPKDRRGSDYDYGICVLDLKPGAKPELLIRDAFDADVWYARK